MGPSRGKGGSNHILGASPEADSLCKFGVHDVDFLGCCRAPEELSVRPRVLQARGAVSSVREPLTRRDANMKSHFLSFVGSTILAGLVVGCASEAVDDEMPMDLQTLRTVTGEKIYREWKKVFSVDAPGNEKARTHVGFLYRRFSDSDPEGKYVVLDRAHTEKGFLLSNGRAYVLEKGRDGVEQARDLGNTGLEGGVKKILNTPGGIELEVVQESAAAPAAGS
jgi:hypothetical protein